MTSGSRLRDARAPSLRAKNARISSRAAIEGWAGLVVGPSSRRQTISEQASEKRLLISFMINFGVAFDLVLAKGYVPPPWPKRQRRKW